MNFKVLRPELFIPETDLLGKYNLWENTAMSPIHICHLKDFGTEKDKEFLTKNTLWAGFNTRFHTLRISCYSFGGMCGLEFTRDTLKDEDLSGIDRECIEYTYKFIDDLKENGVIE